MAHPEHLPMTFEGNLVRLMEECAEVQKAASKVLRFGDRTWEGSPTNGELLEEEMNDLVDQIARVRWFFKTTMLGDRAKIGESPIRALPGSPS